MTLHSVFTEARLQFDAARREQAELAAQALELKLAQRDILKAAGEIKSALAQLEAQKPAPPPAKPTTAAPAPKAAVPTRKATPKPAPKPRPKPLRTIDDLEARLGALSERITALASRLTK